jgi:hypothetical protein
MPTLSVATGPVAIGGRHVVASVRSYTSPADGAPQARLPRTGQRSRGAQASSTASP